MQFAKAITKSVRISPRKARYAADLIRGLSVPKALDQLNFCKLRGGRLIKKTLESAAANAGHLFDGTSLENMKVHEVRVDAGTILKRAKSRSKGSTVPIMKRTSHFSITISHEIPTETPKEVRKEKRADSNVDKPAKLKLAKKVKTQNENPTESEGK